MPTKKGMRTKALKKIKLHYCARIQREKLIGKQLWRSFFGILYVFFAPFLTFWLLQSDEWQFVISLKGPWHNREHADVGEQVGCQCPLAEKRNGIKHFNPK